MNKEYPLNQHVAIACVTNIMSIPHHGSGKKFPGIMPLFAVAKFSILHSQFSILNCICNLKKISITHHE